MEESSSDLEARMRALSDESLARVVFVESDSYRDEALAIAKAEAERRGLKAEPPAPPLLAPPHLPGSAAPLTTPTSRLHPVWPGFALSALVFLVEVASAAVHETTGILHFAFFALSLVVFFYWLACVHRIHVLLDEATSGAYPIRPGNAVASHFIPLFNLYWLFAWPLKVARFVRGPSSGVTVLGVAFGVGFFGAMLILRLYDGAIGSIVLFATLACVQAMVRKRFGLRAKVEADRLDWSSRAETSR
jgi:hypothetical protein